jgi:hypothetical protein
MPFDSTSSDDIIDIIFDFSSSQDVIFDSSDTHLVIIDNGEDTEDSGCPVPRTQPPNLPCDWSGRTLSERVALEEPPPDAQFQNS